MLVHLWTGGPHYHLLSYYAKAILASSPLIKPRYEPTPLKMEQQTITERTVMTEDQSLKLSVNSLLQKVPCQRCRSYHQGYILWQLAGYQDLRQLQLWLPDFLSELEEHLEWSN